MLDDHHVNNIILSVLPADDVHALPDAVWDHVGDVRNAVMCAIEDLSPTDWSFVFTNVLIEGSVADREILERVRRLAEARRSLFVRIRLSCHIDELRRA